MSLGVSRSHQNQVVACARRRLLVGRRLDHRHNAECVEQAVRRLFARRQATPQIASGRLMLRTYFRVVLKQHQHVLRSKSFPEHARNLSHTMRFTLVVDFDEEEESRSESELPSCFFVNIAII